MGWCWDTINGDSDPWLQVDFEYSKPIIAIDTLGHSDVNVGAWVASYKISYSQDGSQWTWYKNNGNVKVRMSKTPQTVFPFSRVYVDYNYLYIHTSSDLCIGIQR